MKSNWLSLVLLIVLLNACNQNPEQIKHQQYTLKGKKIYETHCQNCHQQDGTGLGNLIPPLKGGHFSKKLSSVSCSIRYGNEAPFTIDSISYIGKMPPNPQLTPLEIAYILTFIDSEWGEKCIVSADQVNLALQNCEIKD
jgi:mono/diheme cytochrome c family protein